MKHKGIPQEHLYGQPRSKNFIRLVIVAAILFASIATVALQVYQKQAKTMAERQAMLETARLAEEAGNREQAASIVLDVAQYGVTDERLMRQIAFGIGQETRLNGHNDQVKAVAISRDGRYAVSGAGEPGRAETHDTSLIIWDLHTGDMLHQCVGHTDSVTTVAFNPTNLQVASGSRDGSIRIWQWDNDGCRTVQTLPENNAFGHVEGRTNLESGERQVYIWDIAYLPDGTGIVSAGNDGTMILWDLQTGEAVHQYVGTSADGRARLWVNTLAVSPDGRYIVSGSDVITREGTDDTLLMVHRVASNRFTVQPQQTLIGHRSHVISIAFNPVDASRVLTASRDGTIRYWDLDTGEIVTNNIGTPSTYAIDRDGSHFQSVAISPDGQTAVFGTGYFNNNAQFNQILVWDLNNWHEIKQFTAHTGGIWDMMFTPDGRQVVSASADNSLIMWNVVDEAQYNEAVSADELLNIIEERFGD